METGTFTVAEHAGMLIVAGRLIIPLPESQDPGRNILMATTEIVSSNKGPG
jgi:hypothetical protein